MTKALSLLRRALNRRGIPGGAEGRSGATPRSRPSQAEGLAKKERSTWLRFRYSYRSLTADDEEAHIVVRERRFEDGKLEAEDFEGTVDARRLPELVSAAGGELRRLLRALLERR